MEPERLACIEALEEEREAALGKTWEVQQRRKRRFDKKLTEVTIEAGDLALIYDS